MGLARFFKGLFSPSPEKLKKLAEEQDHNVLVVMVERCRRNPHDCPDFWTLSRELRQRGTFMPREILATTLRRLDEAGFVQRLDGGNKDKKTEQVWYVISENGVNHACYFNC